MSKNIPKSHILKVRHRAILDLLLFYVSKREQYFSFPCTQKKIREWSKREAGLPEWGKGEAGLALYQHHTGTSNRVGQFFLYISFYSIRDFEYFDSGGLLQLFSISK